MIIEALVIACLIIYLSRYVFYGQKSQLTPKSSEQGLGKVMIHVAQKYLSDSGSRFGNVWRPRLTAMMICSGSAFQMKGRGYLLYSLMKRLMVACRPATEGRTLFFQSPPGELGTQVLGGVEPRARRRHEAEFPAPIPTQLGTDFGLLAGGIVVADDVGSLIARPLSLDGIEESVELLMPMSLHLAADDRTVENIVRTTSSVVMPLRL
jgi:hypothetical protein